MFVSSCQKLIAVEKHKGTKLMRRACLLLAAILHCLRLRCLGKFGYWGQRVLLMLMTVSFLSLITDELFTYLFIYFPESWDAQVIFTEDALIFSSDKHLHLGLMWAPRFFVRKLWSVLCQANGGTKQQEKKRCLYPERQHSRVVHCLARTAAESGNAPNAWKHNIRVFSQSNTMALSLFVSLSLFGSQKY